ALAERCDGRDGVLVMAMLNRLGMIHKYQARFADARRVFTRALAIARTRLRAGDVAFAVLFHNLGGLEHARGHFARAEVWARRGLALRARALGVEHRDVARDLAALAAILDGRRRHAEAELLHLRALE